MCNGTIDERVADIVKTKEALSDYIIDDKLTENSLEKLKKYMDRMLEDMETYITISAADGKKTLLANDILYFQADGKFCYAITYTGKIFCNQGLSDLEPQLLKMDFIRCHRSILLNLAICFNCYNVYGVFFSKA